MGRKRARRYFASYPERPFVRVGELQGWEILLMKPNEGADTTWVNLRVMSIEPREHKSVFHLAWSRRELRFARSSESRILDEGMGYASLRCGMENYLRSVDWEHELSKM